jgi:hypothetical protein
MHTLRIYADVGWNKYPANDLCNYFRQRITVEILDKNKFPYQTTHTKYDMSGQMHRTIVLQRSNDTFIIFDFDDKPHFNRISGLMAHPKCIAILKSQFQPGISDSDIRVKPYVYWVRNPETYNELRSELLVTEKIENKLFYVGSEGRNRKPMLDSMRNILNENVKLEHGIYLQTLSKHKIALSLPGSGNFCHRELECFGIGVLVLMPKLINKYYNDLIPGVHYVPITAGNAIKKYYDVINDDDFRMRITANALAWYDANIAFPNNIKLIEEIMEGSNSDDCRNFFKI